MYHVPIVATNDPKRKIEFCHINCDAPAGTWKKEDIICVDSFKINLFMRGVFSVVVEDKAYNPVYGDICVLAPFRLHYGQILKATHTDYYQLNIGVDAFHGVPEGRELLQALSDASLQNSAFIRPDRKTAVWLLGLCEKIEQAIREKNNTLAFAYMVEAASAISRLYSQSSEVTMQILSEYVTFVVNYISENYASDIKIGHLAELCGVSPSYLSRIFKKEVGTGIHTYLNNHRLLQSTYLLKQHSIARTAAACGFSDSSHYIYTFKKFFGCTPTEYLKSAQ